LLTCNIDPLSILKATLQTHMLKNNVLKKLRQSIWPLYCLTLLLSTLLISWHLLTKIDFTYATAYKLLDIDQHIATYAPKNIHRKQFEKTTKTEHLQLFSHIVTGIQNQGKGLADISYVINGQTHTLMHSAEVIHLQDVANLIDSLYTAGYVAIALTLLCLIIIVTYQLPPPSPKQIALGLALLSLFIAGILLLAGPTKTFYWLHTKIFPDNHQWFFYYQESLMTTLMKAPDLFGYIGIQIVFIAVLLYILLIGLSLRTINKNTASSKYR